MPYWATGTTRTAAIVSAVRRLGNTSASGDEGCDDELPYWSHADGDVGGAGIRG